MRFWLAIFALLNPFVGLAQNDAVLSDATVVINDSRGMATLGQSIFFLPSENCDLECAISKEADFTLSESENISFGLVDRPYWFYFDVLDVTESQHEYYLISTYPLIDSFDVFVVQESLVRHVARTGDMYPFSEREIKNRQFVIPLTIDKNKPARVYLRLQTASSLQMNLSIENESDFTSNTIPNELLFGMYFGIILIMSLYNFFIFLTLREVTYVFYSISTISAGLVYAILNGYAFQYLWPEAIHFNQVSIAYAMGTTGIFSVLFSLSFLKLGAYSKVLQRAAWLLMAIPFTIMCATAILGYAYYSVYIGILTVTLALCALFMFISGVYCWYRGNKSARLFIVAWGFYLLGTLLLILRNLGLMEGNQITSSSAMIGQAMEVVLLSFALADRYRIIRKEKEKAQNEKLNLQQTYSRELEEQVKDRTENLALANTKLNISLNDLSHKNDIITEKSREIEDSIRYAKRIQSAILPSKNFWQSSLQNSFVLYKPKDIVAGDFYWMYTTEEAVLFASADCTGHGVPGAMVSVVCNNALNRAVREFGYRQPSMILDKVLELVIEQFSASDEDVKDGMDIALCALNTTTNELSFAGANNPLWLVTSRQLSNFKRNIHNAELTKHGFNLYELKADKQPIGKYADSRSYTNRSLKLESGDRIYIFTDGYADQFGGPRGKKLKYKPFKELLLSLQHMTMDEQRIKLDADFEVWRGELEQVDDVCVIGVSI